MILVMVLLDTRWRALELEDDIGLRVCEDWSEYLIHALVDLL